MNMNIETYQVIIGFFLPVIISTIARPNWPKDLKYWVSFGVVFIAAMGEMFFSGTFNLADIPGTVLSALAMTIGPYLIFWKPSGLAEGIEKRIGLKDKPSGNEGV